MKQELTELINILKAEHRVYQKYLELLAEQQESLIQNDLEGLKSNVFRINVLADEAVKLENGRKAATSRLSSLISLSPDEVTVSKILERLDSPDLGELEKLRNKICDVSAKVDEQKSRNQLLIEQSMRIIRQTVHFMNQMKNPPVTYRNPLDNKRTCVNGQSIVSRTV